MKAIVVRQPWASLIARGIKTIETRPFQPRTTLRPGDRLAIVAGKDKAGYGESQLADDGWQPLMDPDRFGWLLDQFTPLAFGAVVAVVTFDEALRVAQGPVTSWPDSGRQFVYWPEGTERGLNPEADQLLRLDRGNGFDTWSGQLPLGDFTPGRYGWLLSDPQRIDPVPVTGKQGVFTLPDDVTAEVLAQIGAPQ